MDRPATCCSVAEVDTPRPGPGEVRVKLKASGVNPSDVKAREGRTRKIAYPRVIPHSDGAGEIDMVGDGVPAARIGERVWIWNAQWKRAFGTCAEYVVLPAALAVPLPAHVSYEAGACLGIPAMTAYHAVAVAERRHGLDRAGDRRRRRRRPLRHPVRQGARRRRADHGQLRGQGQARARRPAPITSSTTSARTSASG